MRPDEVKWSEKRYGRPLWCYARNIHNANGEPIPVSYSDKMGVYRAWPAIGSRQLDMNPLEFKIWLLDKYPSIPAILDTLT